MRKSTLIAILLASAGFSMAAAEGQKSGHGPMEGKTEMQKESGMAKGMSDKDGMGMKPDETGDMGMMDEMMGGKMGEMMGEMMGMRPKEGMGSAGMQSSSLPGFSGQSHLYHVGATGFFLDHPEHIALSTEQVEALTQKKEAALARQSELGKRIEASEAELFALTSADEPDADRIEKKIKEIEKTRASRRFEFIRAVGDAAVILTDEQRAQILGTLPPASSGTAKAPGANGASMEPMEGAMEPMEPEEDMEPMEGDHM